jgi:hypothetical protein
LLSSLLLRWCAQGRLDSGRCCPETLKEEIEKKNEEEGQSQMPSTLNLFFFSSLQPFATQEATNNKKLINYATFLLKNKRTSKNNKKRISQGAVNLM